MLIQPFPFQHLPRLRRAHISTLRRVRRQIGADGVQALQRWASALDPQRSPVAPRVTPTLVASYGPEQLAALRRACAGACELHGPAATKALLALDQRLCGALLALALGSAPLPLTSRVSEAELGLIAFTLALLLAELGSACCWTIAPVSGSWTEQAVVVEATVTCASCAGKAWLIIPEQSLFSLPLAQQAPAPSGTQRLASLQVNLSVEVGQLSLSLAELEHLAPGDLLLWSGCPRPESPLACLVRVGRGGVPARAAGAQVEICGPYRREGSAMSTNESQESTLAEQLPVEVVVELGRLRLSAAEVMSLGVGDVLTLDQPLAAAVSLRVGDRLLARGELVDVEGEAGVRLTEVFD